MSEARALASSPTMSETTPDSNTTRGKKTRPRRDELLTIAARVFASKGIASATVRDIATEAGILSGSLYHHFTSKEEMVREVLTKAGAGEAAAYRQIFYSSPNADEALRRSTRFAVNRVAENPDVARIYRNDAQYIRETPALAESEERRQSNRVVWMEVVDAGITQGLFRQDLDADLAVRAMWDTILGSIRWFPPRGNADPDTVGDQLADLFLGGIRAPKKSRQRPN